MQYSPRVDSDTLTNLVFNSKPKLVRISSKSKESLPIASDQFEFPSTDKSLTRTGISNKTGDSVAEALKKRKNKKLM